jgi:TolB-like protein/Flp pilus assembly protein TadD
MSAAENKAVFLSYASQDAEAVRRMAEALRAAGVEVWFDQNELIGGDAWDQKIRNQIKACALFVPVISAATQARREGYFRLEWKLAAQRTHMISERQAFLLPVVIDATGDVAADVPDEFRAVQWTRLIGGETPEKFCTRVQNLLGDSVVGPVVDRAPGRRPDPQSVKAKRSSRRVPAIIGLAASIAVVLWQPWKKPTPATPVSPPAATAPVSEARKLVAQARALFEDGDDSNRENLSLAEDLLNKAQALDSTDAEVSAAQAHVSRMISLVGYDTTAARRTALQKQAERAVKLDPRSIEAQIAYAEYLTDVTGPSAVEATRLLQQLEQQNPKHRGILRALGLAYSVAGKMEESAAAFDRANALPGGDARALAQKAAQLIWYGRYAEAEAALADSLALKSNGRAHLFGTMMQLCWRGDLDGAAASLERWPPWLQLEPRGAVIASQVWLWRHEPDKAIAVLAMVPRDSWSDIFFTGPKEVLLALAHEMAGRTQAARSAWENVNRSSAQLVTDDPTNKEALAYKGCALARLGDLAAAKSILSELEQTQNLRAEFWSCAPPSALLRIAVKRGRDVPAKFDTERRIARIRTVFPAPQAALRLNPVFDPIRATPEFQKWLAAAPAPKAKTASEISAAPKPDEKSVAVLAFANLSDDKANEYFSDGISEELLTVLQKIPGLHVAARTSAFSFKGKNATAQEIGEKLGVAVLVEGSVRKAGGAVRITARLSRVANGEQLWSESYNRDLKDVFAVQSELAETIVGQLRGQLGGVTDAAAKAEIQAQVEAAEVGGTKNVAAHELYLQGNFFANQFTLDGLRQAEALFQRAINLDPQFAQAWAALALAASTHNNYAENQKEFDESATLARRAAERAIALAPNLAAAQLARSFVQFDGFDWKGAADSQSRAVMLAPGDAAVLTNGAALAYAFGQTQKAIELARRAVALDPVNPSLRSISGRALRAAMRFEDSTAEFRRMAALSPTAANAHAGVSLNLSLQGRFDEAAAEAALEAPEWSRLYTLALAHWGQKKTAEADATLAQLIKAYADVSACQIAQVYAFRGEPDPAFEWLERAYRQRDSGLAGTRLDPWLAGLHTDPRWSVFLKKLGPSDE